MRAGDLFDKIDIYSVTRTVTNYGDVTEERTIWKEGIRCKVTHLGTPSVGGSEFTDDGQEVGEMKIEFKTRYLSGITFDMEIEYNGGDFNVYSILPIGRREGMRIRAKRRDNQDDSNPAL